MMQVPERKQAERVEEMSISSIEDRSLVFRIIDTSSFSKSTLV